MARRAGACGTRLTLSHSGQPTPPPLPLSRRTLIATGALLGTALGSAKAADAPLPLRVVVRSPWMANQVALTSDGTMFLGLPRYARNRPTPSLARTETDGTLVPFPGEGWNDWEPGRDGRKAFVYLNAVHIFADDTVWCVDQGALNPGGFGARDARLQPGAQKLVQLDPRTGSVLRIIRFDGAILPPGAQLNDLRLHGSTLYLTDSGLGGLIVHDLTSGRTLRRLSGHQFVKASPVRIPPILAHIQGGTTFHPPNSDMVEVSNDGRWLFWASPTGPFRRVETRLLADPAVQDVELAQHVEHVYDNAFAGGCAMDTLGNLYLSETATQHITVRAPSGQRAVLASDPTLARPDGSFISRERRLYVPIKQPLPPDRAGNAPDRPYAVCSIELPSTFSGIQLGSAITGT